MMKKTMVMIGVVVILGLISLTCLACDFFFNYEEITAPIGTVGEIGVRVQKTHKQCTMEDPLDYQFSWQNLQVLGETSWVEVGPSLYEKWFQVSLTSLGEGFFKILKICSKEGYEEAVLPVTVMPGEAAGVWMQALGGTYPFETPEGLRIETSAGSMLLEQNVLTVGKLRLTLPLVPPELEDYAGEARLYAIETKPGVFPLLLVSEHFFVRLDHLLNGIMEQ